MIYVNNAKINEFDKNSISIVTDFDKTLTSSVSVSTVDVFSKFLPDTYVKRKCDINKQEKSLRDNFSISTKNKDLMLKKIWQKKLILLSEYLKDVNLIREIVKSELFVFREGSIETLNYLQKKYQVIINSSGIGNLIEQLLKDKGCSFKNLKIFSNFYDFNNLSFNLQNCIYPTDKVNNEYLKYISNNQLILLGDEIEDLSMDPNKRSVLSIGFLDEQYDQYLELFNKSFSIVATENEFYDAPIKKLKL